MTDAEWMPLEAAAGKLGISVHAARRRVKAGTLTARRAQTRYGPAWEVCLNGDATVTPGLRGGCATPAPGWREPGATPLSGVAELVSLVDRLQRENRDMAGLVGSLQVRVEILSGQLAQAQPALEAPKEAPVATESTAAREAVARPSTGVWSRLAAWFGG